MNRLLIVLAGVGFLLSQSYAADVVLWTNFTSAGETLLVSEDTWLTQDAPTLEKVIGVEFVFEGGVTNYISGSGDLSITSEYPSDGLEGLKNSYVLDASQYTGDIQVKVDLSNYTDTQSITNAAGEARARAESQIMDLYRYVPPNLMQDMTLVNVGGTADLNLQIDDLAGSDLEHSAVADAKGQEAVEAIMYADVFSGNIASYATGGIARISAEISGVEPGESGFTTSASADASAIDDLKSVTHFSGSLVSDAVGGQASSIVQGDRFGSDRLWVHGLANGRESYGVENNRSTIDIFDGRILAHGRGGEAFSQLEGNVFDGTSVDLVAAAETIAGGIEQFDVGDFSGDISAVAEQGDATVKFKADIVTNNASIILEADTRAVAQSSNKRLSADQFSGKWSAIANGGTAHVDLSIRFAESVLIDGQAIAHASAEGINSANFMVDYFSGEMVVDATGGVARITSNVGRANELYAKAWAEALVSSSMRGIEFSGEASATAVGGAAISAGRADAGAKAWGSDAHFVQENFSGEIAVFAQGGFASSKDVEIAYEESDDMRLDTIASAFAYGVDGDVNTTNFTGAILVQGIGGNTEQEISSTGLSVTNNVSSEAGGVGGKLTAMNFSGEISAKSRAGSATLYTSGEGEYELGINATAHAYGIKGTDHYTESLYVDDFSGKISATAVGGDATIGMIGTGGIHSDYTDVATVAASAYAISAPEIDVHHLSGDIDASATGGSVLISTGWSAPASFTTDVDMDAVAVGILGERVIISNFTGNITAAATAGKSTVYLGTEPVGIAQATGIEVAADDGGQLYLNAQSGSIKAIIHAPEGVSPTNLPPESYAHAISSGFGADTLLLGDVEIVGDLSMGGGEDLVEIYGNTRMQGDIYTGEGEIDFRISTGVLTPIGHVRMGGLRNSSLQIDASGGLDFELYEDPADPQNSLLDVEGGVVADAGATIAAAPAAGVTAASLTGNRYEVIRSTDGINGEFDVSVQSLLDLAITNSANSVWITPLGTVAEQESPVVAVSAASVNALKTVMNGVTHQNASYRNSGSASGAPQGAAGPASVSPLAERGEWLIYVRQINDMGGIDSDGNLSGYDWRTHGFLVGAENLLGDQLLIGAAAAGSWTDLDSSAQGNDGSSDMASMAVYGNWFTDAWYTEAGLGYGHAWSDTTRMDDLMDVYQGDYESDLFGSWIEIGGLMALSDSFHFEPFGRLSYVNAEDGGYTETGAGSAPMTLDDNRTESLETKLGVRGINQWELENNGLLRAGFLVGAQYEWLDNVVVANASLLGANQQVRTPESDRAALMLGFMADWLIADTLSLGIEYAPTFSGNWQNHSVVGSLKYKF